MGKRGPDLAKLAAEGRVSPGAGGVSTSHGQGPSVAKASGAPREYRSKAEAEYARWLDLRKGAGEILGWWYEALKLRLGDGCWYVADFLVLTRAGELEIHEVKGWMREKARVKLRGIAAAFPFRLIVIHAGHKGAWREEVIRP